MHTYDYEFDCAHNLEDIDIILNSVKIPTIDEIADPMDKTISCRVQWLVNKVEQLTGQVEALQDVCKFNLMCLNNINDILTQEDIPDSESVAPDLNRVLRVDERVKLLAVEYHKTFEQCCLFEEELNKKDG